MPEGPAKDAMETKAGVVEEKREGRRNRVPAPFIVPAIFFRSRPGAVIAITAAPRNRRYRVFVGRERAFSDPLHGLPSRRQLCDPRRREGLALSLTLQRAQHILHARRIGVRP